MAVASLLVPMADAGSLMPGRDMGSLGMAIGGHPWFLISTETDVSLSHERSPPTATTTTAALVMRPNGPLDR